MYVEDYALSIWQNGSNEDVWRSCFEWDDNAPELEYSDPEAYPENAAPSLVDVANEHLERIMRTPDFTVGDLTHEQVIERILRRHPLLGPNPF